MKILILLSSLLFPNLLVCQFTEKIKVLDNLIGRFTTIEEVYNRKGEKVEEIKALTECKYVLGNSHISLIGYNSKFEANDETSIWDVTYMFKDSMYYVRGYMPNVGRIDIFKGIIENNHLIVHAEMKDKAGKDILYTFDIDYTDKDKIGVTASMNTEGKVFVLRKEIWNRIKD
jgi:hypothetical protein